MGQVAYRLIPVSLWRVFRGKHLSRKNSVKSESTLSALFDPCVISDVSSSAYYAASLVSFP